MSDYEIIKSIESLMLEEFETIPFHNLYYLFKRNGFPSNSIGGTCSDKVLSFQRKLNKLGICEANLHSSLINEKETHRLLRIQINDFSYYCDIGNGWPSIKLFPQHEEVSYNAFGINFQSKNNNKKVDIFHVKENKKTLSTSIPLTKQPETKILEDIKNRFVMNIKYPFSKGIRFAQVIGDEFLFFKGLELRIFSKNHPTQTYYFVNDLEVLKEIKKRSGYSLEKLGINSCG